ncbi:lipopolysaccharide biosynthesis protein [Hymenobacter canadensis]|uniref:Polysaccharide biosynthesis protein n=1 Tax=Hymenobacter canadensis TaxID=2999067 RepID=A0ABY7LPP7_9BACT|nr:hypothetical protein [Hymenobacter canadensis]WBA42393.1 hypothetical protein O3303_02275 [Hymenobacter canadensis]
MLPARPAHLLRHRLAALPARYWVVAGQAVVSATSFLTNIFLAKLCGLATFGAYSAWQLVLLLALAVQGALISQPMQLVHGATSPAQQPAYRQALLGMQLTFSTLAVAAVATATLLLPYDTSVLPAFLVCLVAACTQDTARKLLLTEGQVRWALLSDLVSAGGQLLVLLYWALQPGAPSLAAVLWVVGLTTVPALALSARTLGLRWQLSLRTTLELAGRHGQQARWLLPTVLLQWASSNALLVFAGFAGSASMLGILRLAQTFMGVLNVGLQAVENYALPRLSQSFRSQPQLFVQQRAKLWRTMLLLAAGPIGLLFGLAEPIVGWLQAGNAPNAAVLRWCCLLYVVLLLVYPLRLTVRLLHNARPYFIGYALSIVVSFALARGLVAHWQASGVVLGWIVAQLTMGLYWALAVWRAQAQLLPTNPGPARLETP